MDNPRSVASIFRFADDLENFSTGQAIFRAGDVGDCMYVLRDGAVDISVAGTVVDSVPPGGVFGELALIDTGPRSATAVATAESQLVRVDAKRFEFLVQQHPFFALEVMRVMAQRLRRMNAKLQSA